MAGYDPREAVPFWQRMSVLGTGAGTPIFLRDHSSDEDRIKKLEKLMLEALRYYKSSGA
jgi:predicted Zn-dependent protease